MERREGILEEEEGMWKHLTEEIKLITGLVVLKTLPDISLVIV